MALTIRRASEIHDGRGAPPTADELEQYERGQALAKKGMAKIASQIEQGALDAKAAGTVVGCGLEEVTELHGEPFGDLTAQDILEQGRHGLRGRKALDAALAARRNEERSLRVVTRPCPVARPRTLRPSRSRRPRRTRTRPSRGSPAREPDEPHDHDLARRGGFVRVPGSQP
jgi:hypothetical protein